MICCGRRCWTRSPKSDVRSEHREFRDVVFGTAPRKRIVRISTGWKRVLTKADAASL